MTRKGVEENRFNLELLCKVRSDLDKVLSEFITTAKVWGNVANNWASLDSYETKQSMVPVEARLSQDEVSVVGYKFVTEYALNFRGPAHLQAKFHIDAADNLLLAHFDFDAVEFKDGNAFVSGDMLDLLREGPLALLRTYFKGNIGGSRWITNKTYKGLATLTPTVSAPPK